MEAFNAGLINVIDKLMNILESPLGKGSSNCPLVFKPSLETQISMLAYEAISLVNSILALREIPHPLM